MFADPRTYPPKACEFCGTVMACSTEPYEMSNWPRKRFCSRACRDKARKQKERKAASAETVREAKANVREKPVTPPEKPSKALAREPWESRLNFTPEGSSTPLRVTLVDTLKLHPELGVMLMNPGSTWGKLEFGDRPSKAI